MISARKRMAHSVSGAARQRALTLIALLAMEVEGAFLGAVTVTQVEVALLGAVTATAVTATSVSMGALALAVFLLLLVAVVKPGSVITTSTILSMSMIQAAFPLRLSSPKLLEMSSWISTDFPNHHQLAEPLQLTIESKPMMNRYPPELLRHPKSQRRLPT